MRPRVLIVEDESIVALDLQHRLHELNYECVGLTDNGQDAIDCTQELRPDIVLMDIMLRGAIDGTSAATEIRKRFDVPVVFLTAYSDPNTIQKAKATEPFGYVLKPFDERELHTAIEMALHNHGSERRLRTAERWLSSTLNNLGDAVIATGVDGLVNYMNGLAQSMTGWDQADARGKRLSEVLALVNESTGVPIADPVIRVLAEGSLIKLDGDIQLVDIDGRITAVEATAAPIRNECGTVTGVTMVFRDVTPQKQTRELEKMAEERARQASKMEVVSRLAGGIAHEFNNLMTVVLGQCQLMLSDIGHEDPRRRRRLEAIMTAGERATALTRELLAFSCKQMSSPVFCNLHMVIAGLGDMLRRILGDKIILVLDALPKNMPVKVDLNHFQQVLVNLALNARDAMPEGGKLTISTQELNIAEGGPQILLKVADTGTGMDAETKMHLFEPFYTNKKQGKGTGLGLASVYGIVQQSGGRIEVESHVGQGTTFLIYIPRCEETPSQIDADESEKLVFGERKKILLVEDDDNVRELLAEALVEDGYNIIEAASGREALARLSEHPGFVHLLLTDVVMPEMNGVELAQRISKLRPKIKTLFISGYSRNLIASAFGTPPPSASFMEKPVTIDRLLEAISHLVNSNHVAANKD